MKSVLPFIYEIVKCGYSMVTAPRRCNKILTCTADLQSAGTGQIAGSAAVIECLKFTSKIFDYTYFVSKFANYARTDYDPIIISYCDQGRMVGNDLRSQTNAVT